MAKANCTIKLVKKTPGMKAAAPAKAGAVTGDFQLLDNGNGSFTVQGIDAAGNPVDLSTTFTLAVTSSDTTKVTVGPIVGMGFTLSAVGPLSTPGTPVVITAVVTAIAPVTAGPFTATLPVDVVSAGPTGISIVPVPSAITITS
jgi:hypothetical protein